MLLRAKICDSGFGVSCTGQVYGLFCGIGACQGCLVEVEGHGIVEACMTPVKDKMKVYPASYHEGSPSGSEAGACA